MMSKYEQDQVEYKILQFKLMANKLELVCERGLLEAKHRPMPRKYDLT